MKKKEKEKGKSLPPPSPAKRKVDKGGKPAGAGNARAVRASRSSEED